MINVYVKELDDTWLGLAYTEEKIVATSLSYNKEDTLKSLLNSLPPKADRKIIEKGSYFAEKTMLTLKEVHEGRQEFTDFTLDTEHFPEPLARVLKVAASIPVGYVASYGSIADAAGIDAKLVGQIMASNPLYPIVQCHRVVGADFSLVGYGGRKTPQALKAKLTRLNRERKGYKASREVAVNGKKLSVCPVELVIEKARKQGLTLSDRQQRTLSAFTGKT